MADIRISQSDGHWFYDPFIYGYDDSIFRKYTGTINVESGRLRMYNDTVNDFEANTTFQVMRGTTVFMLKVPTTPVASTDQKWGFYSKARGNVNAAYFFIDEEDFKTITYDEWGTIESNTITWNTDWEGADVRYEIRYDGPNVEFHVNGFRMSRHTEAVPKATLAPMYFYNNLVEANLLDFAHIEVRNAWKMLSASADFYSSTTSTTTA